MSPHKKINKYKFERHFFKNNSIHIYFLSGSRYYVQDLRKLFGVMGDIIIVEK